MAADAGGGRFAEETLVGIRRELPLDGLEDVLGLLGIGAGPHVHVGGQPPVLGDLGGAAEQGGVAVEMIEDHLVPPQAGEVAVMAAVGEDPGLVVLATGTLLRGG